MDKAELMVGQHLCHADVIEYEGELLLVALWFGNPSLGLRRPERVIPLASLDFQTDENPHTLARYRVNGVFPDELFANDVSNAVATKFQARQGPNVTFPLEAKH